MQKETVETKNLIVAKEINCINEELDKLEINIDKSVKLIKECITESDNSSISKKLSKVISYLCGD